MQIKALTIDEKWYGRNTGNVAQELNDLAVVEAMSGNRARAVQLLEEALQIKSTTAGANHYTTATTMCNLARLRDLDGKAEEARLLTEGAIEVWSRWAAKEKISGKSATEIHSLVKEQRRQDYEVPHTEARVDALLEIREGHLRHHSAAASCP